METRGLRKSVSVFRMIREAEDLMMSKYTNKTRMSKSNS